MKLVLSAVRYRVGGFALEVDAELSSDRVTAIFGASGAGKTSLLEIIAGTRSIERGRVTFNDVDFVVDGRVVVAARGRQIGYVPQDALLFPHLTVAKNIEFSRRADRRTLEHAIDVLELEPLLGRATEFLSGGERRRVALARALVSTPRLLLLDEPLAGLEHPLQEKIVAYLTRIRDEWRIPMIYVTHEPEEVVAICSDVLVMQRGRVLAHDRVDQLFEKRTVETWQLARVESPLAGR